MAFIKQQEGQVVFFRSTLLPCPHGFSTRLGGVSTLAHLKSMNLGDNRGDDPENVKENYRRFASALSLPQKHVSAHQIHSSIVLYAKEELPAMPSCDGFYTDREDLTLYVKVADCIPILLYAPDVPAVCALHAGWRGTAANIAGEGVKLLCALGAEKSLIRCAIGIGIGDCCYEVDEPFISAFLEKLGNDFERFLVKRGGKTYADLKGTNKELLLRAGIKEEQVDVCPLCTRCQNDLFFSHRATGDQRGTMAAAIALPYEKQT